MPTALITGGSAGFGLAIARELASGPSPNAPRWHLILTGRRAERLARARAALGEQADVTTVHGDVTDPVHRAHLAALVRGLDLLVNNAGALGPSPLPSVATLPIDAYRDLLEVNVIAPLALFQALRPALLAAHGTVVNVTSDAAVGRWPGWGGYGSSKAGLDQLTNVAAAEDPELRIYALDPGDMRTDMHQAAFPGEDIRDRPSPSAAAPAVRRLLEVRPPSGRYAAADLLADPADPATPATREEVTA